jgi:hypothetical protein
MEEARHSLKTEGAGAPPLGVVRPDGSKGADVQALWDANAALVEENRKLQSALAKIADHSVIAIDPVLSRGSAPPTGRPPMQGW